jgi:hypothetical protein
VGLSVKRCQSCAHLRSFELADDIKTCPVVNIRLHVRTVRVFGCTFHTPKPRPRRRRRREGYGEA